MTKVELRYGIVFGKLDGSDWFDWEVELDDEEESIYNRAKMLRRNLNECDELEEILKLAYSEIEEEQIDIGLSCDDEFTKECAGQIEVDPDDINELVANRDPHTLEYFGLTNLSNEELDEWDANTDVDELPLVCDFEEGFVPQSPFDCGWELVVEFAETPDEDTLYEEEAKQTLRILLSEANGDYFEVDEYIEQCECLYSGEGDLAGFALEIARSLGLDDYVSSHNL